MGWLEQPCTSPLFDNGTCASIYCTLTMVLRLPSGGYPLELNLQQHLDNLGLGGAQYISRLRVFGFNFADSMPDPINSSFFSSLKWVSPFQLILGHAHIPTVRCRFICTVFTYFFTTPFPRSHITLQLYCSASMAVKFHRMHGNVKVPRLCQ